MSQGTKPGRTTRRHWRRWADSDDTLLRVGYGVLSLEVLAGCLGRTPIGVRHRARTLGVQVPNHCWSSEEKDLLWAEYGRKPAGELAEALGRTLIAVRQASNHLGLSRRNLCRHRLPEFEPFVRAKHALGWSDSEIAQAWGTDRHLVGLARGRLGLTSNAYSEHRRDCVRRKTARQLAAAGVASLAELKAGVVRERARAAGWPEDLRPRAVQILNSLWDHGAMTRRELAARIGMPWKGSRNSLASSDPEGSYLAHLQARDLVVRLNRAVPGGGQGQPVSLYTLPLWIERKVRRGTNGD